MLHSKSITIIIIAFLCTSFYGSKRRNESAIKRRLVVSMYPFFPAADKYFEQLETAYEVLYPDIDLVIQLNRDYYDPVKGILKEDADIYELDCILLKDFIAANKIQDLRSHSLVTQNLVPIANVVYQKNKLFAIPHWIRGNFLFYSIKDAILRSTRKLNDLESAIGNRPGERNGLLVDLKEPLRIAELYLDALLDEHGKMELIKKYCAVENIDKTTHKNLNRARSLIHSSNRGEDHTDNDGFYERQFMKRNGRAFVGHSESLYYMIDEIINACPGKQNCLGVEEISLKDWNCSEKISSPMGSVIALAMSSRIKGRERLQDANNFLCFIISPNDYQRLLKPARGEAPRYLLSPFKPEYQDTSITNYAPLYKLLYPLVLRLSTFTQEGMVPKLTAIGKKIHKDVSQSKVN